MSTSYSPLRYPGGKQVLSHVLAHLVQLNGCAGGTYAEPYAGGGGAALGLLFGEHVHRLMLNDADYRIFSMWHSLLNHTDEFLERLHKVRVSIPEWRRQRVIYREGRRQSRVALGFATFYLNRCNRSGIIANGGPIGGIDQRGAWKIDARFTKPELQRRIERISLYKERIDLFNMDAVNFLSQRIATMGPALSSTFVYLDPPYYSKGQDLYLNYYERDDHSHLAQFLRGSSFAWALSYDNVPEIRKLYQGLRQIKFSLDYSALKRRRASEVAIFSPSLNVPLGWATQIPDKYMSTAMQVDAMPGM